jgi:hypothetical protein
VKILRWRVYIDLLGFPVALSFLIYLLVIIYAGIIRFYDNLGVVWGSFFAICAIVLVLPFVGLVYLCLSIFKTQVKMLNLSVSTDDDRLLINNSKCKYEIHRSYFRRILKGNLGTTIVWSPSDHPTAMKTFFIRKQYFPSKEYKKIIEELSKFECFSDNEAENHKYRKKNGLDHIFRKNKLEYEL